MFVLVTNSRPPYCFDVGHVLGLPTGCAYRFRYRKKWIDPNQETCLVKGKPAVIVLRDFATAAFTPCRFAKISKVLPSGDFHWIEFELGEYVSASDLDQLPKFISKALIEINVRNEPSYLLAPLVFSI